MSGTSTLKLEKITDESLKEKLQNLDDLIKQHHGAIKAHEFKEYPNDDKIKSLKKNVAKKQKDFVTTVEKNAKISQEQKIENMINFLDTLNVAHGKTIIDLNSQYDKNSSIQKEIVSVKNMIKKEEGSFGIMEELLKKATDKKDSTFNEWKKKTEDEKKKTDVMKEGLEEELK